MNKAYKNCLSYLDTYYFFPKIMNVVEFEKKFFLVYAKKTGLMS